MDKSDFVKKISDADKKIPDTSDLVNKTDLNAKITVIEKKYLVLLVYPLIQH